MNGRTIPEVRADMLAWADEMEGGAMVPRPEVIGGKLREWAEELRRRPSRPRRANHSERMRPELREAIRAYARAFPDMAELEIGRQFNVNQGRVSETLRGFRRRE